MERTDLIAAIRRCSEITGLAPATITRMAVGNSRLYARLEAGRDCTTGTAAKLIRFMERIQARPRPRPSTAREAAE